MRVTVVRALPGLGDLLCAVPALRALREHHVTLITLPQVRPLAERFGDFVDEIVDFPGWPGIPEVALDPARAVAFLAEQQRRPADLALQLHGSGLASNAFCELLGARRVAGYAPRGAPRRPDFLPWVEQESEVLRPLRLLEHLGLPTAGRATEFPVTPEDEREAERLGLDGPYAVVHPGSSLPDRRWPADRFAAVAEALADARGLTPVITGTPAEGRIAEDVARRLRVTYLNACGATSLGGMAALLRGAQVTITNDTGTSHLAAAVGAPSVVVFMVTDPARWAPPDRSLHRPVRAPASVADVLRQADELLTAAAARAADSGP